MDGEDFSTGQVFDSVAGVGGNIVKYMVDVCIGGFSCDSLFTSNWTDSNDKFVVHGLAVLEERAGDALDNFNTSTIKRGSGVGFS